MNPRPTRYAEDAVLECAIVRIRFDMDGADHVVGVARYVASADGEACEFAMVVADDWQRRALGSRLLALLVNSAATRGLKRIRGRARDQQADGRFCKRTASV